MKIFLIALALVATIGTAHSLELPKAETKADKCAKVLGVINQAANMRLLYEIRSVYYADVLDKSEITRYDELQWSYWNIEKHFEQLYIALECAKE